MPQKQICVTKFQLREVHFATHLFNYSRRSDPFFFPQIRSRRPSAAGIIFSITKYVQRKFFKRKLC